MPRLCQYIKTFIEKFKNTREEKTYFLCTNLGCKNFRNSGRILKSQKYFTLVLGKNVHFSLRGKGFKTYSLLNIKVCNEKKILQISE